MLVSDDAGLGVCCGGGASTVLNILGRVAAVELIAAARSDAYCTATAISVQLIARPTATKTAPFHPVQAISARVVPCTGTYAGHSSCYALHA